MVRRRADAQPDDHAGAHYDPASPHRGVRVTDTDTRIEIGKEAEDGSTILLKMGPAVK